MSVCLFLPLERLLLLSLLLYLKIYLNQEPHPQLAFTTIFLKKTDVGNSASFRGPMCSIWIDLGFLIGKNFIADLV